MRAMVGHPGSRKTVHGSKSRVTHLADGLILAEVIGYYGLIGAAAIGAIFLR